MKTNSSHGHPPKILPWLAKKSGISDKRAEVLWRTAQRFAAFHVGTAGTSDYWKVVMDRLLELIAAEALREDAASFGLRPWSRHQARFWQAPLALLDAFSLASAHAWRVFGASFRICGDT